MGARDLPSLPVARPEALRIIDHRLPVLAFLASGRQGAAAAGAVEEALLPLYGGPPALAASLRLLVEEQAIGRTVSGRCRLLAGGREAARRRFGSWLDGSWNRIWQQVLPALALGLDPGREAVGRYLARRENLESAVLARLFGLEEAGAMPTRARTRFCLLRALCLERFPECAPALREARPPGLKTDALARALILGLVGMTQGTIREAESTLALVALGADPKGQPHIAAAIVRAAMAPEESTAPTSAARPDDGPDLSRFARAVRGLARTMETRPYAGRVAIAQVYDAGVAMGLFSGPLEAFKARIAEAGRAGLLDLERYDIAGPMDPSLRDRSRTVFGRDVRHFIVNEWI